MDTTRHKDEKFGECYFRVTQKVTFAESVTRKHEWLSKQQLHTIYGDEDIVVKHMTNVITL